MQGAETPSEIHMDDKVSDQLGQALLGLSGSLSKWEGANCHYNYGKSLNSIREQYIELLPADRRHIAEMAIMPVDIGAPNAGAAFTVPTSEALRLYFQLKKVLVETGPVGVASGLLPAVGPMSNKRVFIVHGHDELARQHVSNFLSQLKLEPIVLSEQANKGQTVIEKLEKHADVRYAIVLLTPDDEGRKVGTEALHKRARQNVILELGYFISRLGRGNVCALHQKEVEIPSDFLGVVPVELDRKNGWRLELAQEMKAAGLTFNMNDALK
jgi:predicted nucleotide-binding protein